MIREGEIDRIRSATMNGWFQIREGERGETVAPWQEDAVIQCGPCAMLPGRKADISKEACFQAATTALQQVASTDMVIYTDGSKTAAGTGAAFWVPSVLKEWSATLPAWSGVLSAELVAIREGAEWAAEHLPPGAGLVIISDSFSALQVVLFGDHKSSSNETRQDIYRAAIRIHQQGGKVELGWIPSHCGVPGNERADKAAGAAAVDRSTLVQHERPSKKEVAEQTEKTTRGAWQDRWNLQRLGRYRFEVEPTLSKVQRIFLRRPDDVMWRRLRMGVARLALWRSRVLREPSGTCAACHAAPEDLRHVLLDCPRWAAKRAALWRTIKLTGDQQTLRNLLTNDQCVTSVKMRVRAIRDYLDSIKRREWVCMI